MSMDDLDDLLGGGGTVDAAKNNLDLALKLAAQGFPVFPCREKAHSYVKNGDRITLTAKSPYGGKGGFHKATTDAAVIRRRWRENPNALVGLPTGEKTGIAVMDLDRHDGKENGVEGLASLGFRPEDLTDVSSTTPGNGLHLLFKWPEGLRNRNTHILGGKGGIDLRAEGGYIIAPGTVMPNGTRYEGPVLTQEIKGSLPDFPAEFIPAAETHRSQGETGEKCSTGHTPDQIKAHMGHVPNQNMGREEWLSYVAALSHEALAPDEFGEFRPDAEVAEIEQIALDWTASDPAYSTPEALKKVKQTFSSFKHDRHPDPRTFRSIVKIATQNHMDILADQAIEDFGEEDDLGEEDDIDDLLGGSAKEYGPKKSKRRKLPKWEHEDAPDWVKKMSKKHALIIVGGKASVMNFYTDENGVEDHELWDMKTFHDWYLSQGKIDMPAGVDAKGKPKTKPITMSHAFMGNEFRRGYERGYVFDPKNSISKGFNLFVGWGVEPARGDCSKILWHIKHIMCAGDNDAYEYFLDYFAHLFQRPWEIPRAAIVIRSGEGAGKDTWAEYIERIVGRYMPRITGQDQFFGNFNGFLKNALFVNMQEAFVGSQQQNEKLKQYITERTIKVENKYQNAYDTPNLMRLFITSNNFKVVAASESARRFLVLKADERFISNGDEKRDREIKAYFDALYDELNGDGPSALLHYLLNRKLVNFPRIPPATTELSSQVALNWKGLKKFILLAASDGTFDPEDTDPLATKEKWVKDGISIEKAHLRQLFNKWCRSQQRRDLDEFEPTMTMFTQTMLSHLGAKEIRPRGGAGEAARPRHYHFPKLEFCRDHLSKAARGRLDWGDADEVKRISILPDEEDDL